MLGLVVINLKIILEISSACMFFFIYVYFNFCLLSIVYQLLFLEFLDFTEAFLKTSIHSFAPCKTVNVIQCQAVSGSCGYGILQIRGVVEEMSVCSR